MSYYGTCIWFNIACDSVYVGAERGCGIYYVFKKLIYLSGTAELIINHRSLRKWVAGKLAGGEETVTVHLRMGANHLNNCPSP